MLGLVKFGAIIVSTSVFQVLLIMTFLGMIFSPVLGILATAAVITGWYYILKWAVPSQLWWSEAESTFGYVEEVDYDA